MRPGILTFGLALALPVQAMAQQSLPRLHVTTFTMQADTVHPQLEKPFHLLIKVHLAEPLASVDFVVLPNLTELEDLGDERHTLTGPKGTDFSETITVVAHHSGKLHVDPAYFDAIDARDGKPKQFSSNDLNLNVEGGALEDPFAVLRGLAIALAKVFAVCAAVFVIAIVFLRRRKSEQTAPPESPIVVLPPAVPVRSARQELLELLEALRKDPTRERVVRTRKALWARAGAGEGETLMDVLRANQDKALEPVLRTTERAAFIHDRYLQGAIQDMIFALETFLQ